MRRAGTSKPKRSHSHAQGIRVEALGLEHHGGKLQRAILPSMMFYGCTLPIVQIPTIPRFTHSMDLALNSPAHRSLEEITLKTEEDHQDWNQRQSRVREQCAPLNGVGPY